MKREYTAGTAEAITFFVGDEIERTPAYGMRTLFVVGIHEAEDILDLLTSKLAYSEITHIYFGANQSFPKLATDDADEWRPWERMIDQCLDSEASNPGVWCHKLNTLLDEDKFTNWDQYGKDEIIK
jgi:hypothetical protein